MDCGTTALHETWGSLHRGFWGRTLEAVTIGATSSLITSITGEAGLAPKEKTFFSLKVQAE